MLYWGVESLGMRDDYLRVIGMRYLLERIPGILRGRPWTLTLSGPR